MNLQETIRKILREEHKIPTSIRRRFNFGDENKIYNQLKKQALGSHKYIGTNINGLVKKSCEHSAYIFLDDIPELHEISDDERQELVDEVGAFFQERYGKQLKEFLTNFFEPSGDELGTIYAFRKHSEKDGNSGTGRGFSQHFDTWNELLDNYGSWFPSLDWKDVKKTLDSMEDRKQLIIANPEDEFNTISASNYYFSLVKIKRDAD